MSRAGLSDADYWNLVDELIVRASTSPDLGELARALPGVFPTDIRSRLEHLAPRLDSEALARLRPLPGGRWSLGAAGYESRLVRA